MKKLIIAIIALSISVTCSSLYAQQGKGQDKGKPNKENNGKSQDHQKDKTDKVTGQDKVKDNNGNAYGKNKDSLQGREFGQNRAAEAKTKKEAVDNSQTNTDNVDKNTKEAKEKIKQSREKLELKKKNKQITDAEYQKKKKAIDDLESETLELEKKNKENKEKLEKEKSKKE